MNNREKRKMEKDLGILKVKRKLNFNDWAEEVRKNIDAGREKQNIMRDVVRRQHSAVSDAQATNRIASIATDLMFNKKMSYIDAQAKAKEIYEEELSKTESK